MAMETPGGRGRTRSLILCAAVLAACGEYAHVLSYPEEPAHLKGVIVAGEKGSVLLSDAEAARHRVVVSPTTVYSRRVGSLVTRENSLQLQPGDLVEVWLERAEEPHAAAGEAGLAAAERAVQLMLVDVDHIPEQLLRVDGAGPTELPISRGPVP